MIFFTLSSLWVLHFHFFGLLLLFLYNTFECLLDLQRVLLFNLSVVTVGASTDNVVSPVAVFILLSGF
jgi:hypothetical protein